MARRAARGIGWVALLVVPPVGLIWWAGWPLPASWPDRDRVDLWLTDPLTSDTAAVVGWLAWAVLLLVAAVPVRRLPEIVRAAEAFGGALLLLVGLPVGLIWWAGWPLPTRWPTWTQVDAWIAEPLTWPTIVAAGAMLGWTFWGVLLYALLVELVGRLRRVVRWLPRLPIPTPMQGLVGGLFGAAALTMTTPTTAAAVGVDVGVASNVEQPMPGLPSPRGEPQLNAVRPSAGVDLPSEGWLADSFADVVAEAAIFSWWLRRHQYQPGPPAGAARSDPDLVPLPPTVAAIQAARQATAADLSARRTAEPGPVVIGQRGAQPLDVGDLPAGGVGLVGPGCLDAARAVLSAHLLARPAAERTPRLVTTVGDVDRLLGHTDIGPQSTVHVADDHLSVLPMLEGVLLDRARQALPSDSGTGGPSPLVLLTAAPEDPNVRSRLAVLLTLGHRLHVAGVLLGSWPAGTTWQVDHAGTVYAAPATAGPAVRLSVVPAAAAADLVRLARLAATSAQTVVQPYAAVEPDVAVPSAGAGAPLAAASGVLATGPDRRRVRLRLLGGVFVHVGHVPVEIGRSAGVQILALLALHPAGLTSRQLAEAIWPNLRPHLASGRFHTTISDLRRALHAATDGLEVVVRTSGRYRLDPAHVRVDVWRLRQHIDAAATTADLADREAALRAVIDTYTGELATGQEWPWLPPQRESLRRPVIDAYAALAAAHPDQAVYLRLAATRIDPVNAYLYQNASQALVAAGDSAAAHTLAGTYARHLAAAGLAPDVETGMGGDASRPSLPGSG